MEDPLLKYGMHAGAKPQVYINARKLRATMTATETKLWHYLLTNPFNVRFRRQHPFSVYILDFYCHEKRLSLEIDGPNHNTARNKNLDAQRTTFINSMGVHEIRFTNNQIIVDFESLCEIINRHLRTR